MLEKYHRNRYSVFDRRYLNVFFEFKYDPFNKQWIKTEYDVELFKETFSKEQPRNVG